MCCVLCCACACACAWSCSGSETKPKAIIHHITPYSLLVLLFLVVGEKLGEEEMHLSACECVCVCVCVIHHKRALSFRTNESGTEVLAVFRNSCANGQNRSFERWLGCVHLRHPPSRRH